MNPQLRRINMNTIKIKMNDKLINDVENGSMKATELCAFIISKGWKTNKDIEKTALRDLYTQKLLIKGVKIDNEYIYIEAAERTPINLETVQVNSERVYVSSCCTVFVDIHNLKPISQSGVKSDIKELRAKCRKLGVTFSAISGKELDILFEAYRKDWMIYSDKFYESKAFWKGLVSKGLFSGYTLETEKAPRIPAELLYRSSPISAVHSIVERIAELKKEELETFTKIRI